MNNRAFDWNEPDTFAGPGLELSSLEGFKNKVVCFVGGSGQVESEVNQVISMVNGNHKSQEDFRKSGEVTEAVNKAYDWNAEGEPLAYTEEELRARRLHRFER